MEHIHTKDPKPYSKMLATEQSRIRLIGELTMILMKQFKTKEEVEFLLDHLTMVEEKSNQIREIFLDNKVERWKFAMRQFYKWCGKSLGPDFKSPRAIEDGKYYMYMESTLEIDRFLEHAQRIFGVRFSNDIHKACTYPPPGMSKSTNYLFEFKKSGESQYGESTYGSMTCLEYLMSRLFLYFYEGYILDRDTWTHVESNMKGEEIMFGTKKGKLAFHSYPQEDIPEVLVRPRIILSP